MESKYANTIPFNSKKSTYLGSSDNKYTSTKTYMVMCLSVANKIKLSTKIVTHWEKKEAEKINDAFVRGDRKKKPEKGNSANCRYIHCTLVIPSRLFGFRYAYVYRLYTYASFHHSQSDCSK